MILNFRHKLVTKLFVLQLTILLSSQITNAQKNLEQGYVLLTQKDTIYGTIANNSYYQNSTFCDFKANDSDSLKRFFPDEIYGYRFNYGKYYISKNTNKDSIIFLEYIVNGELDVYFHQDSKKINHYYISKLDLPINELEYSKKTVSIEGVNYERESMRYVGLLNTLTQDYPEFKQEILNIKQPNHNKLINFSRNYHNTVCSEGECLTYEKKMKYKFEVEVTSGIKMISLDKENYKKANYPFYGVNFYVNNPNFSEKSYFGIGFLYESKLEMDTTDISYHNFKIPIAYGYNPNKKGLSMSFFGAINIRNYEDIVFTSFSLIPVVKYNIGKAYFKIYSDLEFFSMIIVPIKYYSTNFGISLTYKLN